MKKALVKDVEMCFKIEDYDFSLDDVVLIEKTDEKRITKGVEVIVVNNKIKNKNCGRKSKLF